MPALDNRFLDAALNKLRDEATDIFVCSADRASTSTSPPRSMPRLLQPAALRPQRGPPGGSPAHQHHPLRRRHLDRERRRRLLGPRRPALRTRARGPAPIAHHRRRRPERPPRCRLLSPEPSRRLMPIPAFIRPQGLVAGVPLTGTWPTDVVPVIHPDRHRGQPLRR